MPITFPDKACAITITWKTINITLKATIQKQNLNERHMPRHYSHSKSLCWLSWKTISQLHDKFTLGLKHIAPNIFNATNKSRISIKFCLFIYFDIELLMWRKKHRSHLFRLWKKLRHCVQQKWKQAG